MTEYPVLKQFSEEAANSTDFDAVLKQVKANDAQVKDVNLNNVKVGRGIPPR